MDTRTRFAPKEYPAADVLWGDYGISFSKRHIMYVVAAALVIIISWWFFNRGSTNGYWDALSASTNFPSWSPTLMVYWTISILTIICLTWCHMMAITMTPHRTTRNILDVAFGAVLVLWLLHGYVWFVRMDLKSTIWIIVLMLAVMIYLTFMYWKAFTTTGVGGLLVTLWVVFVLYWTNRMNQ
jgi:hypothetical protein